MRSTRLHFTRDLLGEEQELVGIELFGLASVDPPQQLLFELVLELFIQRD